MSKLAKKWTKLKSKLRDPLGLGKDDKAEAAPEMETPDPLIPDYDELRKAARRRAASRSGGRASTILTDDRLGP